MAYKPKGEYNRAPVCIGENYGYWKDLMHVHINSIDRKVSNIFLNGPTEITMTNADGVVVPKLEAQRVGNDEKIWSYD